MTAPTHVTFATLFYLVVLTSAGVALNAVNGSVMAMASLLPDLDTGASRIGRMAPALSRWLERRFGHRTLTHSLPLMAGLALLASPLLWIDGGIYAVFVAGYVSHPLLDSCTITGVRLLYPISHARCVFPMEVTSPMRYRIRTGGKEEAVLGVLFFLACIPAFLVAYQGYERFVRIAQGTIESAVRDYNEISRSEEVWVDCRAHDLVTKETIEGRFLVAGTLGPSMLLVVGPEDRLLTIGREYHADYAVERAVCTGGGAKRWRIERVSVAKHDSVTVVAQMGDTLVAGEVIAFIGPPAGKGVDRGAWDLKIDAKRRNEEGNVAQLEVRVEKLAAKVAEESAAVEMLRRGLNMGFVEHAAVAKREDLLVLRRRELRGAIRSGAIRTRKLEDEIARLERERLVQRKRRDHNGGNRYAKDRGSGWWSLSGISQEEGNQGG